MENFIKLNILYEDNHLIVLEKPINVPTCLDETNDLDLLTSVKSYLKEKYQKPGNVYVGLVHRLDRPVGGIMVFAKTSKAAKRLSEEIKNNQFKKEYYAVIDGVLNEKVGHFEDYLTKDTKKNIVRVDKSGKYASLYYSIVDIKENRTLVKINLETGRSHQIRVQFASRGYPLFGDQKYNKKAKCNEQIALYAYQLSFNHPVTKEMKTFRLDLPNRYPFNLFN